MYTFHGYFCSLHRKNVIFFFSRKLTGKPPSLDVKFLHCMYIVGYTPNSYKKLNDFLWILGTLVYNKAGNGWGNKKC